MSKEGSKLGSCQSTSLGSILKVPRRNGVLRTDFTANSWPPSQLIFFLKQKYFCWADVPSACPVVLQITGSTVPVPVGPIVLELEKQGVCNSQKAEQVTGW